MVVGTANVDTSLDGGAKPLFQLSFIIRRLRIKITFTTIRSFPRLLGWYCFLEQISERNHSLVGASQPSDCAVFAETTAASPQSSVW
jgi:hypothetical protein